MTQDAQLSDHFSITYAGGAIRADIPPGASTSTLALAQAFFSKLIAQMVGRTQRDHAQEPGASPSSSPAPTTGLSEQAKHKALNRASLSDLPTAPTTTAEAAISSAVWLSDAINEWRKGQFWVIVNNQWRAS